MSFSFKVDVEAITKKVILFGIGRIPVAGSILNGIAGALWPSPKVHKATPKEVFDSIKSLIEKQTGKAISKNNEKLLNAALTGMGKEIGNYQEHKDDSTGEATFVSVHSNIIQILPEFQLQGFEVDYLPLYTQATNAYLAFLRDGVLMGKKWNISAQTQKNNEKDLVQAIKDAAAWVDKYYPIGLKQRESEAHKMVGNEKFNHVNNYVRNMTVNVLDYREIWKYLDPVAYPKPVHHEYTREIYMPAHGIKRTKDIVLPRPPKGKIKSIHYATWGYGVKQLQLDYERGEGPDGKDSTGSMGTKIPDSDVCYTKIEGIEVLGINSWVGEITDGMEIVGTYKGKKYSSGEIGSPGFNPKFENAWPGHYVSSIYLDGSRYWSFYTDPDFYPDTMVVGLKMINM